jgi:hypothetical protein
VLGSLLQSGDDLASGAEWRKTFPALERRRMPAF